MGGEVKGGGGNRPAPTASANNLALRYVATIVSLCQRPASSDVAYLFLALFSSTSEEAGRVTDVDQLRPAPSQSVQRAHERHGPGSLAHYSAGVNLALATHPNAVVNGAARVSSGGSSRSPMTSRLGNALYRRSRRPARHSRRKGESLGQQPPPAGHRE